MQKGLLQVCIVLMIVLTLVSCRKDMGKFCDCKQADMVATVSTFATGLNNPRGLTFGPDGNLYVAEGGIGGTDSTTCTQVIAPVGPYRGSKTGARILKIEKSGQIRIAADKLPSSQTAPTLGSLVSGVADVAFIGNTLYGVLAGAGCSHGVKGIPNGIVKVHSDKSWDIIANLSKWQMSHPVAKPEEDDFEPDGTWYGLESVNGYLYGLEPNHGEIVKVKTNGDIDRLIDISASLGHIVPTAITYYKGNFYVGNLGTFPITNSSNVYKVTLDGKISRVASGFSAILGITFDDAGGMYVLENTTGNANPTPGTGRIIRIDPSGDRRTFVSGLNLPTAITYGPDGNLYVSNWGFGAPAIGGGEILKIKIDCERNIHNDWHDMIK